MERGFIGAKHDLRTDAVAIVRPQPRETLQGTFVIVIPHEQHGGLVISLSIVWLPAQKPVIGAQR